MRCAYRTGRGGVLMRAKTEIEEHQTAGGTRQRIIVTELPYQVNKAVLIKTIADLVKDKKIEGIADVKEESDRPRYAHSHRRQARRAGAGGA